MKIRSIQSFLSTVLGGKVLLVAVAVLVLCLTVRGLPGNPTSDQLNDVRWKDNGPFELSPERGRFALLYSMIEDHSFFFSLPIARFATPDLGFANGKYVSLFAPGVSFLAAIGYWVGKYFGASQVGTFGVVALFALVNTVLIRAICLQLKVNRIAATFAGITFLFATPAFPYAVSLYQHHISTFLILCGLYVSMRWRNFLSMAIVTFLFGSAIPIDYPNVILMLPVAIFAFTRYFTSKIEGSKFKLSVNFIGLLGGISILLPLAFFLWFNNSSYANPLQLASTVKAIKVLDEKPAIEHVVETTDTNVDSDVTPKRSKSAAGFFKTRYLLNGLSLLFISPDRGVVYYTPVVLIGILGIIILLTANSEYLWVLVGVLGFDVLLYSMWGDPWGGWAFGSRYLIPAYAMFAILLGVAISRLRKISMFLLLVFELFIYSVGINTLGAITTNRNPPQIEIAALEKITGRVERYSYDRNWEYLIGPGSKSFFYQTIGHNYLMPTEFFWWITGGISGLAFLLLLALRIEKNHV